MSYLIAGTLTTGVVVSVLNSDNMDKLTNALNLTKNKITQYESNEEYLVSKYGEIKANAEAEIAKANSIIEEKNMRIETLTIQISEKETEIADLRKQLENNASDIKDLNDRIEKLENEKGALEAQKAELEGQIKTLQNANTEIAKANQYIAETLETVNEINAIYTPLTTEELEGITGKLDSSVVDNSIAAVQNLKVYFYKDHTQVTFELPETIDLSMGKQGNIIIKLTDENGVVTRKDKTWAGYLNDSNGNKYGQGIWNNTKYSNTLNPGVYSTTVSKTIKKVELIVTNNEGVTTTLTATN
ncbi:MAG: hypothetical protein IJ094_07855 [Bacilli bacterium]|nr:hypothetical protein [Bacilli bacterium]